MLDELHVQNIALIKDAHFMPDTGLTVLTGETGAGKTALLSALKLVMGQRADASWVRQGESQAVVESRFFDEEHPDGYVVTRKLSADGKSRAQIDGSMSSVKELATCVSSRIDLCGQHEHQRLLKPQYHMDMLDSWAQEDIKPLKHAYQEAFRAYTHAVDELARVREIQESSHTSLEEARFCAARIDEISPVEGEYEDLMAQLPLAEHTEMLLRCAHEAAEALSGEGGTLDGMHIALQNIESMVEVDPSLASMTESLYEALYSIEDATRELRTYRDGLDFDAATLEEMQNRVSALQGLMRAFGPTMNDVFERQARAHEIISMMDHSAEHIRQAQKRVDEADGALRACARALGDMRKSKAPLFGDAVTEVMQRLHMDGARLLCSFTDVDREQWTLNGSTKMEFEYSVGAAMTPRPLVRIASGGEVSRVMLACKVVMGAADESETLVFDEVDAGVGGSTAVALADVLADLACTHQVIVVTHLAQVAVRAHTHYVVTKINQDMPETTLRVVEGQERVQEIARMLSGSIDETACEHARELLSQK